jgi:pentatricopeptide repeat protein
VQRNVKESRRVIQEMKSNGVIPDLVCYNTFLRCLCERNLRHNPSGLVPEALNVMMEMRSYKVSPTSISYNILLSCLGKTRRVKESCQILEAMNKSSVTPDWVRYYLVARVLFLSGRFGKGKEIVDQMIEKGLVPNHKFYYSLIGILCGVERVNHALELFEKMKGSSVGGYGPVYDVLIPKLCRGGNFEKGKELWDEATCMGITLQCSRDVLDPSITEVYKPKRPEKVNVVDSSKAKPQQKVSNYLERMKMRKIAAWKKKMKKKSKAS